MGTNTITYTKLPQQNITNYYSKPISQGEPGSYGIPIDNHVIFSPKKRALDLVLNREKIEQVFKTSAFPPSPNMSDNLDAKVGELRETAKDNVSKIRKYAFAFFVGLLITAGAIAGAVLLLKLGGYLGLIGMVLVFVVALSLITALLFGVDCIKVYYDLKKNLVKLKELFNP